MGAERPAVKCIWEFLSPPFGVAPVAGCGYTKNMTTNLHAHVDTYAVDCDGPLYRDYVSMMTDEEKADQFGDLEFKNRMLSNHVSFSTEFEVVVSVSSDGFEMTEQTDEGMRNASVRWCEDDCDLGQRSQRDVYAEQMGY